MAGLMAGVLMVLALAAGGCRVVQTTAQFPGKAVSAVNNLGKESNPVDPVEVQQSMLRFADEFATGVILATDQLRRETNVVDSAEVLRWKVTFGTQIPGIASGPNPIANLLDMTIFVSVTRMALEQYWQPKVFGASIQPMIEVCRKAETNVWQMADRVISVEQHRELLGAIEEWSRQNPIPEGVVAARAIAFASHVQREKKAGSDKSGSVFELLDLDPLSGLDPATREIAQTRLFAERALYVAHRTPQLLRLQAELAALDTMRIPAAQQLLTNSAQIASSVERFASVAERLPGQVSLERQEILKALEGQEKDLRLLTTEVRQTLEAGSQMSASLNTTLMTFEVLMKRFGVGEPNSHSEAKAAAEPFRIQDYQQTAAQLESTARQLTELLVTADKTMGSSNLTGLSVQAGELVNRTQASGKDLVNYAFWKGILFLAIVFCTFILYRIGSSRFAQRAVG